MYNHPNATFKIEVNELNSESLIQFGSGIKAVDETAEQVNQALGIAGKAAQ